jgi:4'-phosphopantetheinyl transferase
VIPLARGEPRAVLWVFQVPAEDSVAPTRASGALSQAELETAAAFRVPGRRLRYLLGRQLLRGILADLLATEPARVELELGHNNRPQLTGAMAQRARERFGLPLDFNLSSTPGRLACGLAIGGRIGVDVEAPRRLDDLHELARTVMAPEELSWLDEQESTHAAFYRLWTLKEAAAKAHGEGLGLPFPQLRMQPDDAGGLIADFHVLESRPEEWSVLGLDAAGPAALAVHWTGGAPGPIDLAPVPPQGCELTPVPIETTARL